MNLIIGNYQFFTGLPFWIGKSKFKGGMAFVLEWQMGLGFLRVNKYKMITNKNKP